MGYYLNETTCADELVAFLFSCRSNSIRKKILWQRVRERKKISNDAYHQSLFRLKKKGIIEDRNDYFFLSSKGKSFYQSPYRKIIKKPAKTSKVMIIFDIPETKKKTREWLRSQIKSWEFKMVQRSVWIGSGPLPKEFDERLKVLKVFDCVKVYKLQKGNK